MSEMYYCLECKKLFKIYSMGKSVRCPKCSKPLYDLKISDEDYALLDKAGKEALKSKAIEVTEEKEADVSKHTGGTKKVTDVASSENIIAAQNSIKLKQKAQITAEQHATFNNSYLKTQIQGQILAADNFVSICRMSALKNDGVIDSNEDKLIKKITKITEDYTKALNKLI